jgi:hypothetical protein
MSQLHLSFPDLPLPQPHLWQQLDCAQKQILIEMLARLMVQATRAAAAEEPARD